MIQPNRKKWFGSGWPLEGGRFDFDFAFISGLDTVSMECLPRGPSAGARWPGQGKNTREGGRLAASADRFVCRPRAGTATEPAGPQKNGQWLHGSVALWSLSEQSGWPGKVAAVRSSRSFGRGCRAKDHVPFKGLWDFAAMQGRSVAELV